MQETYRITGAQLADIATMVRTGNTQAFAVLAKGVRRRRVVELDAAPLAPKRVVYFADFIVRELSELLDRADMNSLLRSAAYLHESRRDLFYWRLTPEYSHKYYNSTADARGSYNYESPSGERRLFADVLNARLRDTRTQLRLTLDRGPRDKGDRDVRKRRDNTIDLAYLENLHALALRQVNVVGSTAHLATLRELVLLLPNHYCENSMKMVKEFDMRYLSNCASVHIRGNHWVSCADAKLQHLQSCRSLWLENMCGVNAANIACIPNLQKLFLHNCGSCIFGGYARLPPSISLYVSGVSISEGEHRGLDAFRELHFAVGDYSDMEGLRHLAGVESLYLMPKRGKRTLVKEFRQMFPRTREWLDDGTWAENMYY